MGSAAPLSYDTPQLVLHLHPPSLCCSPDDQRIISLKRPGRQRRVERENRQMSGLRGTRVMGEDSHTTRTVHPSNSCFLFLWPPLDTLFRAPEGAQRNLIKLPQLMSVESASLLTITSFNEGKNGAVVWKK